MTYVTKSCPHCGKSYSIMRPKHEKLYGSPFRICPRCGRTFVDKSYHEYALNPPIVYKVDPGDIFASILSLVVVLVSIYYGVNFSFDVVPIICTFIFGALLVYAICSIIYNYISYDKRVAAFSKELRDSETRLSNPEYAEALKNLGFSVPDKYLNLKSDELEQSAVFNRSECSEMLPKKDSIFESSREIEAASENPPNCDDLFYICPKCGFPSSSDQYRCRCGYRLSASLPTYRLCPDCSRFVPLNQLKCDCGYSFPAEEKLLHVCPACGAVSPVDQRQCDCGYSFSTPTKNSPSKSFSAKAVPRKDSQSPVRKPLIIVLSVFVLVVVISAICISVVFGIQKPSDWTFFLDSESPTDAAPYSQAPANTSTPVPYSIPTPTSGRIFHKDESFGERIAPLTVITTGTDDYYVKLRDPSSGKSCLEFYVRGGESVEVDVPLGEFELVYATGSAWHGSMMLFGDETKYFKADDLFEFYDDGEYINGWTVELYLQSNGNLDVDTISAYEFN